MQSSNSRTIILTLLLLITIIFTGCSTSTQNPSTQQAKVLVASDPNIAQAMTHDVLQRQVMR